MQTVDLHLHTCFSDGRAGPEELVRAAAGLGLETIAITDHDNMRGYRQARPLAADLNIELIPAIEFTCRWDGCGGSSGSPDIDVLGYFIDPDMPDLAKAEAAALEDISERIGTCCDLLTAAGYPVSSAEVMALNPRYAGILFLGNVLQAKHFASGWQEAAALIDRFYGQVRPSRFHIDEIIAIIHAAGGAAVLAHPSAIFCSGRPLDAAQIEALVQMGLDGIEVYHPQLDAAVRSYFLELAGRFGLAISGGSDEHGWPAGFPALGRQPVTQAMVAALRQRAEFHRTGCASAVSASPWGTGALGTG